MLQNPSELLRRVLAACVLAAVPLTPPASAQTATEVHEILARLERLEAQNRALMEKVDRLQEELAATRGVTPPEPAPAQPSVTEQLAAQEARTAEQQQDKVEASERFPIRLTGMALFNAYRNGGSAGGVAFPTVAAPGGASAGATFRQTILGLDYFGPSTVWAGKISGSLRMDFFGGSGGLLNQGIRLRTASIGIDWTDRSLTAALDKAIIATREPESLAQVGITPLTGAGNLWLWLPQVRVEQVFRTGENSGVRAQASVLETHEATPVYGGAYKIAGAPPGYASEVEPGRPGYEGRVEFFHGSARRIEIAPGFHYSLAHAAGGSAPTEIYTLDWLVRPAAAFEFTGSVFRGTNTAALGGLQQGIVVLAPQNIRAVHSAGGWGQLTWRPSSRVWFNLFAGQEDPRASDLPYGAIGRNLAYGGNIFCRLAPNVLTSFELSQYRTTYLPALTLLSNHYDLALAYRF